MKDRKVEKAPKDMRLVKDKKSIQILNVYLINIIRFFHRKHSYAN